MIVLFCIFLILTVIHFIHEYLILPTARQYFRYRLFALRDMLRGMDDPQLTDEVYHSLQEILNNSIRILPELSFSLLMEAERYINQEDRLVRKIEKRQKIISECPLEEVQYIYHKCGRILFCALTLNCLLALLYLLPIFLIWSIAWKLTEKVAKIIETIISLPEKESPRIPSLAHVS